MENNQKLTGYIYRIQFKTKKSQDPLITHVLACSEEEAIQKLNERKNCNCIILEVS